MGKIDCVDIGFMNSIVGFYFSYSLI